MSGDRLYTAEEVAAIRDSEVRAVLKGLLRNLDAVRLQRAASVDGGASKADRLWTQGQVDGLKIAILAVRRRAR